MLPTETERHIVLLAYAHRRPLPGLRLSVAGAAEKRTPDGKKDIGL